MAELLTLDSAIALITLTFLEIVLGIDNIIFISILTNKLSEDKRKTTRNIGLALALIMRVAMLGGIKWLMGLEKALFSINIADFNHAVSIRDLVLFGGGLFLIAKSTMEIHHKMDATEKKDKSKKVLSVGVIIAQVVLLDLVFSFDSILTAIGLADQIAIMITAVIISIVVMMIFAGRISRVIERFPTLQVLALAFLILIGFMLVLESVHHEVPKGYIYFAVAFSLGIELLNIRIRRKRVV